MRIVEKIRQLKESECIVDTLRSIVSENECVQCGKCVFGYEGVTQLQMILTDLTEK